MVEPTLREAAQEWADLCHDYDLNERGQAVMARLRAALAAADKPPTELREALRAVLRDFDREPTEAYLDEAERIFRAADKDSQPARDDRVARLEQALRVATHKPHDQLGESIEGFPVCSVCGAIQTAPSPAPLERPE